MTTKEAGVRFGIDAKKISELCKKELIIPKPFKENNKWNISETTTLVLTEEQILQMLHNLLLLKNNPHQAISWEEYADRKREIFDLLSKLGFTTEYHNFDSDEWMQKIQLTEKGFKMLFKNGNKLIDKIGININNNMQFSLIKV